TISVSSDEEAADEQPVTVQPPQIDKPAMLGARQLATLTPNEATIHACCQDEAMSQKDKNQAIFILGTLKLFPVEVNAEDGKENDYLLGSKKSIASIKSRPKPP
ncbi:hypothetical protein MBANPS3_003423, partial [Mucor bainieri]